MNPSPNMAQVAAAAGVHQSTVSLALRNHRSIPPATCERIQKIAREMGYRPNPMISALIAARRSRSSVQHRSTLAYLTSFPDPDDLPARIYQRKTLADLSRRAETLGYRVELFWLRMPGMNPTRMKQILLARNIRGIVVCPLTGHKHELDFDFSEFATVMLNQSLQTPKIDRVTVDYYETMRRTLAELRRKGYRRITYSTPVDINERKAGLPLSAYLLERFLHPAIYLPPLFGKGWVPKRIIKLVKTQRPDAIITASSKNFTHFKETLERAGYAVPGDIALANLTSTNDEEGGMFVRHDVLCSIAVEYLTQRIERGEFGIPEVPRSIHVTPEWRDGLSVAERRG